MRYLAIGALFAMMVSTAFAHLGPVIEVPRLTSKPTIDGDLSDWENQAWTDGVWDLERVQQQASVGEYVQRVLLQDSGEEPEGTPRTRADLSGQYFMAWDESGLYLGVKATDNVHDVSSKFDDPAAWYLKDSCSWFFDVPHDADGFFTAGGDHVFSFVADDTNPVGGSWWRHGEHVRPERTEVLVLLGIGWRVKMSWLEVSGPQHYRVKIDPQTGTNYTIEAFVPFGPTWMTTPAVGDTIGGPMIVHTDPDGGLVDFGGQLMLYGLSDNDATWADMVFVGPKK